MADETLTSDSQDIGSYLMRGGYRIELDKEADRFTMTPQSPEDISRLGSLPGVLYIQPLTRYHYKVVTTPDKRDMAMDLMRSESFQAVAHHAYRPKNEQGTLYYITDQIFLGVRPGISMDEVDRLLEQYHLKLIEAYENLAQTYLVQVTSDSKENPVKIANRLMTESIVKYAEPNLINRFQLFTVPKDPLFANQWHLQAYSAPQLIPEASIDAPKAWEITQGSRDVVVALCDDGFDLTHPDFQGMGKIVFPKDYVDGDESPLPLKSHHDYHGTPCAGVAIAESNGVGVVGAAPGCAFMPVRFPLNADDRLLIKIFNETGEHADVISCSWGPPPVFAPLATPVYKTIENLAASGGSRGLGCVICFAAANFDAPINDPENIEGFLWLDYGSGMVRKTTGPILNGFAAHPNVMAVAASTSLNKHAAYSNWGKEISISAPSNNFNPRDPRDKVPGRGIWTTDNEPYGEGFTENSQYTGAFGGTSSAAPLAAGVAALVLSANPQLKAVEVRDILEKTADKIRDTDPDVISGKNRGVYDEQGHCEWFGFGKINAGSAVAMAKQRLKKDEALALTK